jgi:hypothetical protein
MGRTRRSVRLLRLDPKLHGQPGQMHVHDQQRPPRFLVVSMVAFDFSLLVLSSFVSASHELAVPSS